MSGASSRRKGNHFEVQVAAWLRDRGWRAITSRDARGGAQGGPDLITDLPVCVEVKNHSKIDLAGWVDQAVEDAEGDPAAVWVKRRGKGDVGQSYVVMRACDFDRLVKQLATAPLADDLIEF